MQDLSLRPELVLATLDGSSGARWLDVLGLGIVLLFLVLGALRGLWWQIVRLLGILATVSVARAASPQLGPALQGMLTGLSAPVANGLAWLLILVAGLVLVALVGRLGKATLQAVQLSLLDRAGGAVAGALSGILLHAAIVIVLCQTTPRSWSQSVVSETRSAALVHALGRGVPRLLDVHAAESLQEAQSGIDAAVVR